MAGFSEQRAAILDALVGAGLGMEASTQIANILGNSIQEMRHAGPVALDSTPPDLRQVSAAERKVRFTNLDVRLNDPDHRPQRVAPSENRKDKEPEPNVTVVIPPQQTDATFRIANGSLTEVAGDGQAAAVNVRNVVAGRPPAGLPITMLDSQANQLVGKAPQARVLHNDGTARMDLRETGRDVTWQLQMLNREDYDVVTDVEYLPGKGLRITYERIKAWNENKGRVETIPAVKQDVVSDVIEDKNGLRAKRRTVDVFAATGQFTSFFNTFRIGKFTGQWLAGATKTVTQVWPEPPAAPVTAQVKNLTTSVANSTTAGGDAIERYVLYAIRSEDKNTAAAAGAYDQDPITKDQPQQFTAMGNPVEEVDKPKAVYYAISIQPSEDCDAFSSLDALRAGELTGYDASRQGALTYEIGGAKPCLRWAVCQIPVITGVTDTGSALVFSRSLVNVICCESLADVTVATTSRTVLTHVAETSTALVFSRESLRVLGTAAVADLNIPIADCPST
jgi:hypothetical protein